MNLADHFFLGVVPARGGSVGIPQKNIKDLSGLPLITYTLQAAKRSKLLNNTVVSTDCPKIANVSEKNHVQVLHRPKYLSGSKTPMIDVILNLLNTPEIKNIEDSNRRKITDIVILQPTSPFRTASDIDKSIKFYIKYFINKTNIKFRSLVGVSAPWQHPSECVTENNGRLKPAVTIPKYIKRRQDYPNYWFINGAIYITSVEMLKTKKIFYNNQSALFKMDLINSIDIDEPIHFKLAESVMRGFSAANLGSDKILLAHPS